MTNPEVKIYENEEQDKGIKTELKNLASTIDVKEKDFSLIDKLFGKLNTLEEAKKNLALQYALKEAPITIGSGGEKKLGEIAELFDRAVEQDGNTWKIKLKESVELSDEEKGVLKPFLNEKESSLAYLIQRASNFAKVEAQKGYGQESDKLVDIGVDSILGNQTRRALSGLKSWIESDLTAIDDGKIKELTPEEVLAMKFIPKELKEKIEASDNEAIKSLWANEKYEIKNPYTSNRALKIKEEGNTGE